MPTDHAMSTAAKPNATPASSAADLVLLVRDPIDSAALIRHVRTAADGAIVTFDGCVRNQSHGRRTLYLDYEAYESMAVAKMREIAAAAREKFLIDRVAIAHRLGRLEIGETSVFIAVSSPHRPAAFDACRFAIDTLKRTVPIWKKEYFEDGAVWADGDLPSAPPDSAAVARTDTPAPPPIHTLPAKPAS
jgi:MoaE-MoaD fusion protein